MTLRMAAARQPSTFFLLTLLGAASALASGCQPYADIVCQHENGLSGEAYSACIESFESAGTYARAGEAEAACERHWEDCRSRLSSNAQAFNPFNSCRDEISGFDEKDSDAWSDQANRAKNLFMGCKAGAKGYFDMIEKHSSPDCRKETSTKEHLECIQAHPGYPLAY